MKPRWPFRRSAPVLLAASVAVWWIYALAAPQADQPPPPSADRPAFQPVPDTSPVPNYYFARGIAVPRPTSQFEGGVSHTEFFVFYSRSLDRPMHYLVYEPAGYFDQPDKRYPVLYMLHGLGGGVGSPSGYETEWPGYGLLAAADKLIAGQAIQPLLIVMPEGDQGYWMDHPNNGPRYGSYASGDLVQEVDARFRTVGDRQHRAIGGMSMGGFGALSLAMLNPDVFGAAAGHSASLPAPDKAPAFLGDPAYVRLHHPADLMAGHPETASRLKLWLDVASGDPLWKTGAEQLHNQLEAAGIGHEWHTWPGAHDGLYWGAHVEDYLRFYNGAFGG